MSIAIQTRPAPATDVELIPALVERLRLGFDSGRTRSLEWRREQLERLRDVVRKNGEELVRALHADLRKPAFEAWLSDVSIVVAEARRALENLEKWTAPEPVSTPLSQMPARARIVREPLGVALIIAPWNYPVQLLLNPLVGAIAAGNCAVLKPSELTPHTSGLLARLLCRYLDPDCVTVVEGGVPETTALLEQRFDHIFYTGNGRVARIVMEAAARHLTPVTLELGGKSPCIVDETADLQVAARRIAWGKFLNAGQTCIAPDYVLVSESREPELLDALVVAIREFYGEDPRTSPHYARVVDERHHRRLSALLKDGQVVVGGGSDESDRFIEPTVLRDVDPASPVMAEEIFGPILPVLTVKHMDEAIRFVNRREKPLALYLFTSDPDLEKQVIERTSSGGVCVNSPIWQVANPNLPFGGVGESGMGAYHGRESFETFSHRKAVVTRSTRFDQKVGYPPYGKLMTRLARWLG